MMCSSLLSPQSRSVSPLNSLKIRKELSHEIHRMSIPNHSNRHFNDANHTIRNTPTNPLLRVAVGLN